MSINIKEKRMVVTGGAGFLGKFVVSKLKKRGCKEVFVPRSRVYNLVEKDNVIPEIVGNAALLIDPSSDGEIAQAILDVLKNASLRVELVEKGLNRVKLFSWEKTAEGIISSCEKVFCKQG